MVKYTEHVLLLLRLDGEVLRSREVWIELYGELYKHKYEIITELFNEGYIDGYYPEKGPIFTCTLSEKAMNLPLQIGLDKHIENKLQNLWGEAIL